MHLDEDLLERLLDGELTAAAEVLALQHLRTCAACRAAREALAREAAEAQALLATLDLPAPRIEAEEFAARIAPPGRPRQFHWARAALLLLTLAGAVAAAVAVPGSPFRHWFVATRKEAPARPINERGPETPDLAGVEVDPGASLVIRVRGGDAGSVLRVSLGDGAAVTARAPQGAATFTSSRGLLQIDLRGAPTTLDLRIPRAAPFVQVLSGETALFTKRGELLETAVAATRDQMYVLPLAP